MSGPNYKDYSYLPVSKVTPAYTYGYRFGTNLRHNMPTLPISGTLPWSFAFGQGDPLASGSEWAYQGEIFPFVDAVTERMLALNWLDPISGMNIQPQSMSLYFTPQSGDMACWAPDVNPDFGITPQPFTDAGFSWPILQNIVYDMAKYYANGSGSPDSIIYPAFWTSGYFIYGSETEQYVNISGAAPTELLFPLYHDLDGSWHDGPSSSGDYAYPYLGYTGVVPPQAYYYRTERSIPIPVIGAPVYPGWTTINNDPNPINGSGIHPWPPPSGFSRIFPREIYQIPSSGFLGQVARFTVLQNHQFSSPNDQIASGLNYTFGHADPINQNYTNYTTPSDQQHLAGQMMYYSSSGWILWNQAGLPGLPPINPDFIQDFGLIHYGDYMGPWILNDLKTAINRLTTVCAMNTVPGEGITTFTHPLYPYSSWTSNNQVNSEGIFIPNDVIGAPIYGRYGPLSSYWRIWTNPTNIASAWGGTSGTVYPYNYLGEQCTSENGFEAADNNRFSLGSGSFNDVFYTQNYTIGSSGSYVGPAGFYDDYIDLLVNAGEWPSGLGMTFPSTLYWRGYKTQDDYTITNGFPTSPFNLQSFYSIEGSPFGGVGYPNNYNDSNIGGQGWIASRYAYLTSSGFLPNRSAFVTCYALADMNGPSGLPYSGVLPINSLYNDLGQGLNWRQWNRFASGTVMPNITYFSTKLGTISTPPTSVVDPITIWPSGTNGIDEISPQLYINYQSEGYQINDFALVVSYNISGGFSYQGPYQNLTYISPSGYGLY